jgi:hypothetical protein
MKLYYCCYTTLSHKCSFFATLKKDFLHKIETGDTDPYYEHYMLKLVGIERTLED